MKSRQRRVLLLGNLCTESVLNALASAGLGYVNKVFASSAGNWKRIAKLLKPPESEQISAVLAQLTESTLVRACLSPYDELIDEVLENIRKYQHGILVYSANLRGDFTSLQSSSNYQALGRRLEKAGMILPPADELRQRLDGIVAKLSANNTKLIPYTYTSELTASALAFLQDTEKGLVIRFYVPGTRIHSREFDRFVELLQDYFANVTQQAVSLDKRRTGSGVVYSFFSREELTAEDLQRSFDDIASLLALCAHQPGKAVDVLERMAIERGQAERLVSRFGREARRIIVDIDYERRARLLEVEHQLQAELVDATEGMSLSYQTSLRTGVRPLAGIVCKGDLETLPLQHSLDTPSAQSTIALWDKFELQDLRPEEIELVKLIRTLSGDQEVLHLVSAFHELRDKDLDRTERLSAWGKLQGFITRISPTLGKSALTVVQNYISHMLTRV